MILIDQLFLKNVIYEVFNNKNKYFLRNSHKNMPKYIILLLKLIKIDIFYIINARICKYK
ncbi:MAG: hypothetical protein JWP37_2671 [Mucilaginibacter sp.]|nr:hypothetical protein [Mucilaginibacter sp.]